MIKVIKTLGLACGKEEGRLKILVFYSGARIDSLKEIRYVCSTLEIPNSIVIFMK